MPLHPVGEAHPKFRAGEQRLEQSGDLRRSGQIGGEIVDVHIPPEVAHRPLRIPDDEREFSSGHARTGGAPVVVRPVAGAGIDIDQQVVDEVVQIKHRAGRRVRARHGHVLTVDQGQHLIPLHAVAFTHLAELRHQIPVVGAPVPGAQEVRVDALGGVVVALILAIEEQVGDGAVARDLPHVPVQTAHQLIHDERVGMIIHARPQGDALKHIKRHVREKRILQPALAIITPEIQPEGIFAERQGAERIIAVADITATLHAQAGIQGKTTVVFRTDQLRRHGSFPGETTIHGVAWIGFHDAGRAPEVFRGGDEGQHRQRPDGLTGIQQICVRERDRRQLARRKRRRPQRGGGADGNGAGVNRARGGGGFTPIHRITDRGSRLGTEVQVQRLIVKTAAGGKGWPRGDAVDRALPVGRTGGRRREVTPLARCVSTERVITPLLRVLRREHIHSDAGELVVEEAEKFTGPTELEIRVQLPGRITAVLGRGEDQQIPAGREGHLRQRPLTRLALIIGQRPAGEVGRGGAPIMQLDPVSAFAVFIRESGDVRGEELVDHHVGQLRGGIQIHLPASAGKRIHRL